MKDLKFHFIFSKNDKSLKLKRILLKKFKNYSLSKSNVIIVCGGDGFMLRAIQKFYKFSKPFFGINCGTIGFLMNQNNSNYNLIKNVTNSKSILVNPIIAQVSTYNKKKFKLLAINEVSLLRQTKQTSSIRIFRNKKILIKNLSGDGVLLSTPIGSTAYNFSVGGPVLNLKSEKLALTPISVFKPRKWKGQIISQKNVINFKNLKMNRPISIVADNFEIRNVHTVSVKINNKIKIHLLFNKKQDYKKKLRKLIISN
jgi:NAD+ kinase